MSETKTGINPASKPFIMERSVDAPRQLVWEAWTRADHLKQWFGPKGFKLSHCELELKPDGVFLYAMEAPDGNAMWGKWIFREITPPEKLVTVTAFSNDKGGVTRHPMAPDWPLETISTTTLTEESGKTKILIEWRAYNATDVEQKMFDGSHDAMKEGWGGTFDQLTEYLAKAQGK